MRQLAGRLVKFNGIMFSNRNVDYLNAIDALIDCADNIDALVEQLACQQAEITA